MGVPCPCCTRNTGDGLPCSACTDKLRKNIEKLPQLMRDLQITYSRQSQAGTGNGGKGDTPVPFDKTASRVGAEVVNMLGTWIRDLDFDDIATRVEVCTCRPYEACRGYVDVPLEASTAAWCSWLAARLPRIRRHPAAAEIAADMAGAVNSINRAVDPRMDVTFCGFCFAKPEGGVRCTGQLWAGPGKAFIKCPVCQTSYDVKASRVKLLKDAEDQLATAAAILTAIAGAYGIAINNKTFYSWVLRGRLLAKGSEGGVAVYRVGDALELARAAATRRKAG